MRRLIDQPLLDPLASNAIGNDKDKQETVTAILTINLDCCFIFVTRFHQ